MPYLRFKGFPAPFVEQIAPAVVDQFASIVDIPKEKVKLELLQVLQITNTPLSVEIMMFPRAQRLHDELAAAIHDLLFAHDYRNVHIFFILLSPELYYKEGKPLQVFPGPR
ncbi:DUF1904 family protein [Paenibacillus validus]|uniref:DUF1904 family protein n=1 Tax=Paenibacillus TaxID=44249 RepID=UPI000FD6CC5A|nr:MULTISPECIES: DUF1904 family protein [Paenibacillus]MED4603976.1 DUF1904 family protein [Paenibacillus validus]MED4609504.1 DUF1904 family protein [Paenibacillus validus]